MRRAYRPIEPPSGTGGLVVHNNGALSVVADLPAVIYCKCKTPRCEGEAFVPLAGGDSESRYPLF